MMRPRLIVVVLLLAVPTVRPAAAADKATKEKPAKIKVNHKRGFLASPVDVTLRTAAGGGQLYFTTDGRVPSPTTGQPYTAPIRVTTTTILRAAGYEADRRVTELDTHTFLLLSDVMKQTGAGAPATWGTNHDQPVRADYEIDPEIAGDPVYHEDLEAGLKALPSLALAMDPDDLFGAARGIYSHPQESGDDWEREASLEFIAADEGKSLQADCGIRIQGGWNRRPEESPKHAFRLVFRKKYGAGKLKARLFDGPGTDEFDTLILRAGCNNTWLHWSGAERKRGDYIRDQWMRETYAAMGHPSARGLFVHLYLNGLYWGVYNLTERPDERFAADHLGGGPKDYDARNADHVLAGDDAAWKRLLELANTGLKAAASYQAVEQQLDLSAFADFMLVNLYGANADWDHASNWYAARRRDPPGPFQFFIWDGERTLEEVEANTLAFDDDQSPPRLFQKLRENEEFRVRFGDRVQRHLGPAGALSPDVAAARFAAWARRLDRPIVAESARWGDYRRDVHSYKEGPYELYTRDHHWRVEIARLMSTYFPKRTETFLAQLREAGLYPTAPAPKVRLENGTVALSTEAGSIYYTDDGSDPRRPGGAVSTGAHRYEKPFAMPTTGVVKARTQIIDGGAAKWSALVER